MGASEEARPRPLSGHKGIWENEFLAPSWGNRIINLKIFRQRKASGKYWAAIRHDGCALDFTGVGSLHGDTCEHGGRGLNVHLENHLPVP